MLLCVFVGTAWAQNLVADKAYYLKLKDADLFIDIKNGVDETSGQTITVSAIPVSAYFTASGDGWTISTEAGNKGNFLKVNRWCANPCMAESSVWTVTESDGAYVLSQSEYQGNGDANRVYLGNDGGAKSAGAKLFTDQAIANAVRFEFVDASQYTDKSALKAKISEYKSKAVCIPLQTSDPKGAFYLSATEHGDAPIDKMIDGKADTYYGSTWGSVVGHRHYWQVDLVDASALPEFTFEYITRGDGKDTPTKIDIKGSKDGSQFTNIVSLEDGLPTTGGASYKSATISNSEGYRYIRFEIPSTTTNFSKAGNAEQEVTFALAEFALFKTEANYSDVDKYILSQVNEAQKVVDDENASQAEVDAALAALTDAIECTVKYSFQYGGVEKYSQTAELMYGDEFPAFTVLPIGVLGTKPEGIVTEDITKVITLSIDNSLLPFVAAKDYNSIDHWYYMNIRDTDPTFAHYSDTLNYIPADTAAYDEDNRDAYTWAFVGNPIDGFSIVNLAAGSTMVLSSPTAPTGNTNAGEVARMVTASEATGNKVWSIMPTRHNGAPTGAFYIQHPTETSYAFNRQNIGGKKALAYWTGRDTGSSLQVIKRPMGVAPQIEALVVEAEALLATVQANIGSQIGEYTQETANALSAAIAAAKAITEDKYTTADSEALQAAMDAVKPHLPTPGKYYLIHSSLSKFAEHQAGKVKAAYSDGTNVKWTTANEDDKTFYWQAVATNDGGVAFQNAKDGKYMIGNKDQSGDWTVSDTYSEAAKVGIKLFKKGEDATKNEYGVILNGWQMHCKGHTEGKGESGNVVSWNTDIANSASSWYVVEVELPVFYDVTYNFVYNGEVKFSQTSTIKKDAAYPEIVVPVVPYGVTAKAAKPEGTVTKNEEVNFELTVEKELPFKPAADLASVNTWYYLEMHANPDVTSYIEDNQNDKNNIEWADRKVTADDDKDSHLWGFAGDIWNGIKVVNKKTGRAIVSKSGDAIMGDVANATAFIPVLSNGNINSDWFCLKYPESNFMNAGSGKVGSYGDADNGSSLYASEDKELQIEIADAGFATLYHNTKLYIPSTVEAYVVSSVTETSAKLEKVQGTLPANTAVILKGAGQHKFVTSADSVATFTANKLSGTMVDKEVAGPAYVLASINNVTGFYAAKLTDGKFVNNAGKAYLPKPATASSARFLSFDFGTETAIENIEGAEYGANAVIYDLSGRRVQKAQKGLYIVNGKKVVK